MSDVNGHERHRPGVFSVKLTTLSVVLLCISVSSLASLVVVATITKADALATVALALAVLAFAAQLIVTIAQSQASAGQTRDTFRINAETKAVLAELQAQGKALVALQSGQFEKLLDKAINADTVGAALSQSSDVDDSEGAEESPSIDPEFLAVTLRALARESVGEERYPSIAALGKDDGYKTILGFQRLSTEAQELLMKLVDRSFATSQSFSIGKNSSNAAAAQELEDADFIRRGPASADGSSTLRLAMKGTFLKELLDPSLSVPWARTLQRLLNKVNHRRIHGLDMDVPAADPGD